MKWLDFSPYVLPYVIGCPDPTLEMHARLAAIEFFRRTLSWREVLDAIPAEGSELVELEAPMQTQIIKVKSVSVDGRDFPLVETTHGSELSRTDAGREFAFTRDNRTLVIYPIQAIGTPVVVEAALAPSITSSTLPDALAQHHMQDIAHGAIASLKRFSGQPFTDPNGAQEQQALFERRISAVAAKHSRGVMAAKLRSRATFL
jgi:hypothetical protein